MHHAALAALAVEEPSLALWRYYKFELAPTQLAEALPLFYAGGFAGMNFTVPHKEVVVGLAASVDEFARAAGAANTLIRTPHGWHARNTDGSGLAAALLGDFGLSLRGADVVLLGAGGAARAAALQCLRDGVRSLWIGNRTATRLEQLLAHLRPFAGAAVLHGFALGAEPPTGLPTGTLVVNATTSGLQTGDAPPADLTHWPRPAYVYDMVYNPPETPLLAQARVLGIRGSNGLSMLAHQGAHALSFWTGRTASAEVMLCALRNPVP